MTDKSKNSPFKGNILIIDDTLSNLRLLSSMLEDKGYEVRCANSGEMGLQTIKIEHPDLILLDINMPKMDGYEVFQSLKNDERLEHIPVIFLSAFNDNIHKIKALEIGAADYISKPFHILEVLARIENQLKIRRIQKELEEKTAAALLALEKEKELNRLKSHFTYMIAHDFRNPLTTIQGFIALLESKHESLSKESVKYYSNKIDQSVNRLLLLLDDILLLGSMENSTISFYPQVINVKEFFQNVVSNLQSGVGNEYEINYRYLADFVYTNLDVKLLDRIFSNLLHNAIKYSSCGSEINFDIKSEKEDLQEYLVFQVEDNGIGIPINEKKNLFKAFYRCSNVGKIKGTGLGLAIVKKCVEAHQGSIDCQSQEGKGTTFTVKIPMTTYE